MLCFIYCVLSAMCFFIHYRMDRMTLRKTVRPCFVFIRFQRWIILLRNEYNAQVTCFDLNIKIYIDRQLLWFDLLNIICNCLICNSVGIRWHKHIASIKMGQTRSSLGNRIAILFVFNGSIIEWHVYKQVSFNFPLFKLSWFWFVLDWIHYFWETL